MEPTVERMKNFNLGQKCDIRNRLLSLNCTKTSQIFRLKSATSFPKFTHKHKQRSWHSSNFPSSSCGWDGVKELSRNSSCFSFSRHDRLKAGCGKLFRFSLRDISPKALESRDFRTRRTISLIDLTSDFLIKATGTFSSPSIRSVNNFHCSGKLCFDPILPETCEFDYDNKQFHPPPNRWRLRNQLFCEWT